MKSCGEKPDVLCCLRYIHGNFCTAPLLTPYRAERCCGWNGVLNTSRKRYHLPHVGVSIQRNHLSPLVQICVAKRQFLSPLAANFDVVLLPWPSNTPKIPVPGSLASMGLWLNMRRTHVTVAAVDDTTVLTAATCDEVISEWRCDYRDVVNNECGGSTFEGIDSLVLIGNQCTWFGLVQAKSRERAMGLERSQPTGRV